MAGIQFGQPLSLKTFFILTWSITKKSELEPNFVFAYGSSIHSATSSISANLKFPQTVAYNFSIMVP